MTTSNKKDDISAIMKDIRPFFWMPFVICSVLILLIVAFITDYNIRQSEKALGRQMADMGIRAIWLFENVLMEKIHFKSIEARNEYLHRLGTENDFAFLAVTDNKGLFLVHSDMEKIGSFIDIHGLQENEKNSDFWEKIELLLPNRTSQGSRWGYITLNDERLFLVHRIYGESERQGSLRFLHPEIGEFLNNQNTKHVFVAMHPKSIQEDIIAYKNKAFRLALWILGTASLALWIFSLINRIITNRKNMDLAEKTIASMREEVHELEKEITQKEKMAAIGDLAAGVAHEIRNPLSSIKGYATYFASRFAEKPEYKGEYQAARIMIQEVERLNRVVGELMGVSRPTDIRKIALPIDGVLESCVTILQGDAKQLGITFQVQGKGYVINMDPDRIKQAVLNICLNAIEAIRDDMQKHRENIQEPAGFFERTFGRPNNKEKKEPKKYCIAIHVSETENSYYIEISDNGSGIEEEVLGRIFDPYFTTKSDGTGLGLINADKILQAHGGNIEVESKKDVSTTFKLYLPK